MRRAMILAMAFFVGCGGGGSPGGTTAGTTGTGGGPPASLAVDWTFDGPTGGRVDAVAVDPQDPAHLVAATDSGGVFESKDGGGLWVPANQGITTPLIAGVAFDPGAPGVVLALTSDGIFRRDGGDFQLVNADLRATDIDYPLQASPAGDRLVVATSMNTGVSTDHGKTWQVTHTYSTFLADIAFDPVLPDVVYLAINDAVLRSDDGGASFSPLAPLPGPSEGRMAAGKAVLYAGSFGAMDPRLYRSDDGGMSWQSLPPIKDFDIEQSITVSPDSDDDVYVGGSFGLYHSKDGGQTWEDLQEIHACPLETCGVDIVSVVPDWDHQLLWVSHDQGIYSYDLKKNKFEAHVGGLTNVQAYTGEAGPSGALYLGTQDTGVFSMKAEAWENLGYGDAGDVVEPEGLTGYFVRHALSGDGIWYVAQDGTTTGAIASYTLDYPRRRSMIDDPAGGGVLVASKDGVFHLGTDGQGTLRSSAPASKLSWDEGKATLYVAREADLSSVDAAGAASLVHHFDANIDDLVTRGETLLVIAGGAVNRSSDGGKTWAIAPAPTEGARSVAANPRCPEQYLVGYAQDFDRRGTHGVYLTRDGGETWDAIGDELALYAVTAIVFREGETDTVYAATYGRGMVRGKGEIFDRCR
ncbi:MAG: hypothetical protein U0359_29590 [Byssovorax sp.]